MCFGKFKLSITQDIRTSTIPLPDKIDDIIKFFKDENIIQISGVIFSAEASKGILIGALNRTLSKITTSPK